MVVLTDLAVSIGIHQEGVLPRPLQAVIYQSKQYVTSMLVVLIQ